MAEPLMDNPLAPSPHAHYVKITQDIKECIEELKQEFEDTGIPINDDNRTLQRFCAKTEYLLQAGLKARSGLLGGKKDYWNYFCDCLASNKSTNDGIRFVKTINELKTNLGRGRALLRFCLMHQRLADTVQQCVYNGKITGDWYHPKSMWYQPSMTSDLVNALYDLSAVQFDLSPRGYDLDASWPSFARKTFGTVQHVHNWSPPSRSTSINSLSSTNLDNSLSLPPPSPQPSPAVEIEAHKLKLDLSAATRHQQEARQQLEVMENEKLAAESKTEMVRTEVQKLEQELRESREQCRDLEVQCDKLSNEMKVKEDAWEKTEVDLKSSLTEAENCIAAFGKPSAGGDSEKDATDEPASQESTEPLEEPTGFQRTELGMKLMASEKRYKALQLELKSVELQLKSKQRIEEQKTTLISLLDKKLESVEAKKKRLLDCLESAVKDKEAQNKRLIGATNHMTALSEKLHEAEGAKNDAETLNAELTKANNEYKAMLKSLEEKSSKIAKLAKEKVIGYSAENKKLKQELEDLKSGSPSGATSSEAGDPEGDQYKKQAAELQQKLEEYENSRGTKEQELATALQGSEKLNQEIKDEMEKLRQQLQNRDGELGQIREGDSERMIQLARESTELREGTKGKDAKIEELEKTKLDLEMIIQSYETNEKKMKDNEQAWQVKLDEQMEEATRLKAELAKLQAAVEEVTRSESDNLETTEGRCKDEGTLKDTASFVTKLSALASKTREVCTKLTDAEMLNADLQEQAQLSQHATQQLQLELTKAGVENAELKTQLKKTEASRSDLESKVKVISGDLDTAGSELKISEHQYKDLEKEKLKVDAEITDLKMILEMKNQDISDFVQKLKEASSDRERASENQDSALSERDRLQDQVIDLQTQVGDFQGQLKVKEQVEERLQGQLENADSDHIQKVAELQKVNEGAMLENANLKEVNTKCENEISQLKQQIQTELDTNKILREEVQTAKERNSELETALKTVQDSKEMENTEHNELVVKLQEANQSLANELENVKLKIDTTAETNTELTSEVTQKELLVQDLEKTQAALQEELKSLKENNNAYTEKLALVEKQHADLKSTNEALQNSNEVITNDLNLVQTKFQETEEELKLLKETQAQTLTKLSEATAIKQELETEKEVLEKELLVAKRDANDLKQSLTDLEHEKSVMTETLTKSSSETEQKVQELLTENSHLKQEARKTEDDLTIELNALKTEKSHLEENIAQLKTKVEEQSSAYEELQTKMYMAQNETTNQLAALNQSNQSLQEEMAGLKDELGNANEVMLTKDTEYEKMKSGMEGEKANVEKEFEKFKEEMKKKERIFADEADGLQKEISALRFQLSSDKMIYEDAMRGYETQNAELATNTERLSQQDTLIESLEVELRQMKEQKDSERQKLRAEIQDLRESLSRHEEGNKRVEDKLKRTQAILETEKENGMQLQNDMVERTKEWDEERQQSSALTEQLQGDIEEMKKKLIQLLREKDSLWQKSEKLEHLQKVKQSEKWLDDSKVTNCMRCSTEFSLFQRKHHCRLCGRIFCHSCSANWIQTAHSSKKERVCTECLMNHSQAEERSEGGSEVSSDSDFMESIQIPGLRSPKWNSRKEQPDFDDYETEVKQPAEGTEDLGQVSSTCVKTLAHDLSLSEVDSGEVGRVSTPDPDKLQSMTDDRKLASATSSREDPSEDDGYDVITQEDLATTEDDVLPDPDIVVSPTLSTHQISRGEIQVDPELWIGPGKMYALPVMIEHPGTKLCWEFTTQPKNIHFCVSYRESDVVPMDKAEYLIPSTKVNSHKQAITGELQARKAGVYTLFFDNKFSRFTSKQLNITLDIGS